MVFLFKKGCFIGSGTIVKEGVSIGERSVVGMGSLVRSSLSANSRFLGESLK